MQYNFVSTGSYMHDGLIIYKYKAVIPLKDDYIDDNTIFNVLQSAQALANRKNILIKFDLRGLSFFGVPDEFKTWYLKRYGPKVKSMRSLEQTPVEWQHFCYQQLCKQRKAFASLS